MGHAMSHAGEHTGEKATEAAAAGMDQSTANISDGIDNGTRNISDGVVKATRNITKGLQNISGDVKKAADHVADDAEKSVEKLGKDIDIATATLAGTVSSAIATCTSTLLFLASFHISAAFVIISMWLWVPRGDTYALFEFACCWTIVFAATWQVMTRVKVINAVWWPIFATVAGGWTLWMASASATMLYATLFQKSPAVVIACTVVLILMIVFIYLSILAENKYHFLLILKNVLTSCCGKIRGKASEEKAAVKQDLDNAEAKVSAEKAILKQDVHKAKLDLEIGLDAPLLPEGGAGEVVGQ